MFIKLHKQTESLGLAMSFFQAPHSTWTPAVAEREREYPGRGLLCVNAANWSCSVDGAKWNVFLSATCQRLTQRQGSTMKRDPRKGTCPLKRTANDNNLLHSDMTTAILYRHVNLCTHTRSVGRIVGRPSRSITPAPSSWGVSEVKRPSAATSEPSPSWRSIC